MTKHLNISQCKQHGNFILRFYNSITSLTSLQMKQLIMTLHEVCDDAVALGWTLAFHPYPARSYSTKPEFKLCMGRITLVLSHVELVEMMSQMWKVNPSLMQWATQDGEVYEAT